MSVTGHLTGKSKYIYHYAYEDVVKECESDDYGFEIGAEKYSQNEDGKWKNTDNGQKWHQLYRSETRRYLSPGECLVLYPIVSEIYHYQLLVEFNHYVGQDTITESVEAVQGEWTQKGQYWSTEVSSDVTDITNPQLNVTSKEAAVPSFKENGLPNYALLIHGNAQTKAVTGYGKSCIIPSLKITKLQGCGQRAFITNGIRIQENMKLATKIEKIEVGTSSRILKTMRIRPIIIIVFMLIPSLMKWQQSYH